jgi:DNA mismatch repair protein MutS
VILKYNISMPEDKQKKLFEDISDLTPAMKQYLEIKSRYKDCILFFRMGDFYEMFFEDAITASKILGIVLTTRDKRSENQIPLCGVPYHSAKPYIDKLLKNGFKVAICEQVEDPKLARGIVKREVIRVLTPGLPVELDFVESTENTYIASVVEINGKWGFSYLDITTGEMRAGETETLNSLINTIINISPKEILLDSTQTKKLLENQIECTWTLSETPPPSPPLAKKLIEDFFKVKSLHGFGIENLKEGLSSAWMLLEYVKKTQGENIGHISAIKPHLSGEFMILDASTLRSLEIFSSAGGEKRGSLINLLDRTKTPMGARKLREWLRYPLKKVEDIKKRLAAVESLCSERIMDQLSEVMKKIGDIERSVSRISMRLITPQELEGLSKIDQLAKSLKEIIEKNNLFYLPQIETGFIEEFSNIIRKYIKPSPSNSVGDGNVINEGISADLDYFRKLLTDTKSAIARMEMEERAKTGIPSLKIGYNKVFGYYIEVTKPHLHLVPKDYIRKQTLVNAERFVNEKLKTFEEQILSAEEKVKELETKIFNELLDSLMKYVGPIKALSQEIATIDCFLSLAEVAQKYRYVKPEIDTGDIIEIKDGRHPVVEAELRGEFVPNDLYMDRDQNMLLIITGPNMAGKSTYLRQVALTVIMAQMGSFVPASYARIGIVDRIFTRIGAADDITRGRSTFLVEMNETANILHNATERSLIILDEVGRGTSTFDGISIAWAVCEYILNKIKARTLFATHYHELTELEKDYPQVKNFQFLVKEWSGQIIFLRKIARGASSVSYGIEVANIAGIPSEVIKRAKEILVRFESMELEGKLPFKREEAQISLFGSGVDPVREALKSINIATITPLEAINKLYELKKMVESEER